MRFHRRALWHRLQVTKRVTAPALCEQKEAPIPHGGGQGLCGSIMSDDTETYRQPILGGVQLRPVEDVADHVHEVVVVMGVHLTAHLLKDVERAHVLGG